MGPQTCWREAGRDGQGRGGRPPFIHFFYPADRAGRTPAPDARLRWTDIRDGRPPAPEDLFWSPMSRWPPHML